MLHFNVVLAIEIDHGIIPLLEDTRGILQRLLTHAQFSSSVRGTMKRVNGQKIGGFAGIVCVAHHLIDDPQRSHS